MGQFDRQIATAERLIKKYGQAVIWRQIVDIPNTDQPWKASAQTTVEQPVTIAFIPMTREYKEMFVFKDKTEVTSGFVVGLMKGNIPFTPGPKDVVVRNGKTYDIETLDPLSPNGQQILWTMIFKT